MLDVYPGEVQCRTYSPHALWHELTAYSFQEMIYVSDIINEIVLVDQKVKAYEEHYS